MERWSGEKARWAGPRGDGLSSGEWGGVAEAARLAEMRGCTFVSRLLICRRSLEQALSQGLKRGEGRC